MKTVSVCSSFYEQGRQYLDDCVSSILAAVAKADCRAHMVIAIDDLENPKDALAPYADKIEISFVPTDAGTTITGVRNALFEKLKQDTAEVAVFLDMDDVMAPDGIQLHLDALAHADISYGDMWLIASDGKALDGRLYEGIFIPDSVTCSDTLLQRNFLGLSNTAVRRTALDKLPSLVPDHLVATDWWLYTSLINAGCTARRTAAPIGAYRQHQSNVLGSNSAADLNSLAKRCKIVRDHYAALPSNDVMKNLDQNVAAVEVAIKQDPKGLTRIMEQTSKTPGAWFEEIFQIAKCLRLEP